MKKCRQCENEFKPIYSSVEMFCSKLCSILYKKAKDGTRIKTPSKVSAKKPIAKRSAKRKKQERSYSTDRKEFLQDPKNRFCFIEGCGRQATTVEHRRGRVGYADEWARENNVPLLLDKRWWAPCCWSHNLQLENDPALSKKYQLSKIHGGKKD
jgi:hypothetical protein